MFSHIVKSIWNGVWPGNLRDTARFFSFAFNMLSAVPLTSRFHALHTRGLLRALTFPPRLETYFSIDPFRERKVFRIGRNEGSKIMEKTRNNFHRIYLLSSKGVSINFIKNIFSLEHCSIPLIDSSQAFFFLQTLPRRGALSTRGGNFIFPSFEIRPDFDSPPSTTIPLESLSSPSLFLVNSSHSRGMDDALPKREGSQTISSIRVDARTSLDFCITRCSMFLCPSFVARSRITPSFLPSFLLVDDVSAALIPTRIENNAILYF